MPDADGTNSVPFWVTWLLKLAPIPEPFKTILQLVVNIYDQLPAFGKQEVLRAAVTSKLKDEPTLFTGVFDRETRTAADRGR